MKVVCVIPARLHSKRFPRKVLSILQGKPLLQWIWEKALAFDLFDEVVFAVDAQETAQLVDSFFGKFLMTPQSCTSGTDRLIFLMKTKQLSGEIWINWQGDEPLICRTMMTKLLKDVHNKHPTIWSLRRKLTSEREIIDPNVVKVVTDHDGHALYFSRSPIPYFLEKKGEYYKHIGIYAYNAKALKKIKGCRFSCLEEAERLEQLRFLENGLRITLREVEDDTVNIDHPKDLVLASNVLSREEQSTEISMPSI